METPQFIYASYVDGNADVIEIDVEGDQSLYIYYRNGHFQNVVERFEWGEKGTAETRMLKVN